MDWIPLRFSKNESLGYYEYLACDFQDKSMRAHVDGQLENHKKESLQRLAVSGDIATWAGFKSHPSH